MYGGKRGREEVKLRRNNKKKIYIFNKGGGRVLRVYLVFIKILLYLGRSFRFLFCRIRIVS